MAARGGTGKAMRFDAVLETADNGLGWTIARLPLDPTRLWSTMVRLRVRGTVARTDGGGAYAFRTSLFADSRSGYYLLVNRAMLRGSGTAAGGTARFVLEPDLEPRPAELPDALGVLLDSEDGLRAWYDALSEYTRREIGKWVQDVKSEEALERRAEQMAERLLATMEAELELPPAIVAAFRRRPKARAGWAKMTVLQRRGQLMAVFYYRTPESRAKRLETLCDLAEAKAGE